MKRPVLLALGLLAPLAASAHPGHLGDHDFEWAFTAGLQHPWSGWDHLLAMVAVGWWAVQLGGRARWIVPTAFVGAMALGAGLASAGLTLPGIEPMIAASVVTLGVLIARRTRLSVTTGSALVGTFALFHGAAHAAEFSTGGSSFSLYAAGFLLATLSLHALGGVLATVSAPRLGTTTERVLGWLVAASGFALFAA